MTLVQRVRTTVELTELLFLSLLGAMVISLLAGAGYVEDRSVEVYTEQVACVSLNLVMMVIVGARGALVAREVYEKARSDASLRVMYIYALFPLIFIAVVLSNATAYFASILVFGLPLFIIGMFVMFWAGHVLEREVKAYLRRTAQILWCYGCGQAFYMDREEEFTACPRCHLINRNPLLKDSKPAPPTAPPVRGVDNVWFDEGITPEHMYGGKGRLPLREVTKSRTYVAGIALLVAAFTGCIFLGTEYIVEWWPDMDEYTGGAALLVVVSVVGLIGLLMRRWRYGRPMAVVSGGLLCAIGLFIILSEGVGFFLVIASLVGTYLTSRGMMRAARRGFGGSRPRKVLFPRGKAPEQGTEGTGAPVTQGPGTGAVKP